MKCPWLILSAVLVVGGVGCGATASAGPEAVEALDAPLTAPACAALPRGPLAARLVTEAVYQSEELSFDGRGLLVAKKGEALVGVPPTGPTRVISRDPSLSTLSLGLRHAPDGSVIIAQPAVAEGLVARLLRVTPAGAVSDFFTAAGMPPGLPPFIIPNGLHVDSRGAAWVSDYATSQLFRVGPAGDFTSLVVGPDAQSVGGLVLDERRGLLYYTSSAGVVWRLPVTAEGQPSSAPVQVVSLAGARLDGVALDACGSLYLVDSDPSQGRYRLLRQAVDDGGVGQGPLEVLATFDDWISGVQFGAGPGWDRKSVYVSGIWGKVWQVRVGVPGR